MALAGLLFIELGIVRGLLVQALDSRYQALHVRVRLRHRKLVQVDRKLEPTVR